jgi:hypothetical protein
LAGVPPTAAIKIPNRAICSWVLDTLYDNLVHFFHLTSFSRAGLKVNLIFYKYTTKLLFVKVKKGAVLLAYFG